jgi:protoporphyrinogen oxidase
MKGRIGVLGGGISGLTFASLARDAEILEKDQSFGGLMRSIKEDGYTFDLGSHIIFSRNKHAMAFMLDALEGNQLTNRRSAAILYKGIRVKYPFENGLGDLPKEEAAECFNDYAKAYADRESGKPGPPRDFRAWMHYRFGKAITEKYLYPYNRKIWDYPPELMDLFWVEGRVPQPPLEDVRKAAMGLQSEGYTHQLNFHYPKHGGIQAVADGIASRIEDERKVPGFEVRSIRKEDGKWVVGGKLSWAEEGAEAGAEAGTAGRDEERIYERLVSTIHVQDLVRCCRDAGQEVRDAAQALRWNSVHLVMIGLDRPKPSDLHWAYIPDSDVLPNRISFPGNMSPETVPRGRSSVLAEITFSPGGAKARMKGSEVVERTVDDLQRIGVLRSADVAFTKLVTCRYAYVVYDLDYLKNIGMVEGFAAEEGITLLGRWGEFRYHNSDRCVENAIGKAKLFA